MSDSTLPGWSDDDILRAESEMVHDLDLSKLWESVDKAKMDQLEKKLGNNSPSLTRESYKSTDAKNDLFELLTIETGRYFHNTLARLNVPQLAGCPPDRK